MTVTKNDITLPAFFSDSMILQRDSIVKIWGTNQSNDKITVKINDITVTADCTDTKWQADLPKMPPGGPHKITISNNNAEHIINDVYIGEVWFAAGQSNMIARTKYDDEKYKNKNIKIFNYSHRYPQWNTNGWLTLAGNEFSHVAGNFAYLLQEKLDIPIGIFCAGQGSSKIESWLLDGQLYNDYIKQFPPYTIKGFIWWQGESNAGDYAYRSFENYKENFRKLITTWRQEFGNPNLPFIYNQLQRYLPQGNRDIQWSNQRKDYECWPILRQAQLESLEVPNTAMSVIFDLTDGDLHPPTKDAIAQRMFLAARGLVYEDVEYSGPIYKSALRKGDDIIISFDHTAKGLNTPNNEELKDFERLGNQENFRPIAAKIKNKQVIIPLKDQIPPFKIRYSYNVHPLGNLYNSINLPASPFITDLIE